MTRLRRLSAFLRNTWRGLTSMRTALILLFLLAIAALPGALLPQRSLNPPRTADYIARHGWWGELLDRLQFFDIYASVWFSAIYLMLFISLVGCLLPRMVEYARSFRARPVLTPRNLSRMPHHVTGETATDPDEVVAKAGARLKGWRTEVREEADGSRTISAERGYLRELGNLVFHFAMLGMIVALAVGKLYNYEGQVIVVANGSQFCNSGTASFDSFRPGLRVDGTDLNPFCLRVNELDVDYLDNGQADQFTVKMEHQAGEDLDNGTWRPYDLRVNHPLRIVGDRVYLLGHGYAPTFTVTFPNGEQRTQTLQWRTVDDLTLLSQGALKFDPPGITDSAERRQKQIAITGLFAPTAIYDGTLLSSSHPELRDPAVAVDVLRGDLGLESGSGQSIFDIDQALVDSGRLNRVARENLTVGEELTLDDGTRVRFDGVDRWGYLQVSHDPSQVWVLVFSIAMFLGLGLSLVVKRRRFWVRATPSGDGFTVVTVGGLARTDQAGYGEEFSRTASTLFTLLSPRRSP
ncbi:cytochrome c biogenesis protein ResB [Actinokineospora pegani]|uniref:cytochrome c biogenesis protein ResB n=1 Tax=Actinokineospora pegani TaxID=2654637 RepID=UPI0012EAE7E8|nr:cytochrome c biogenesis protein ResB [Actinokineospora pegani]